MTYGDVLQEIKRDISEIGATGIEVSEEAGGGFIITDRKVSLDDVGPA